MPVNAAHRSAEIVGGRMARCKAAHADVPVGLRIGDLNGGTDRRPIPPPASAFVAVMLVGLGANDLGTADRHAEYGRDPVRGNGRRADLCMLRDMKACLALANTRDVALMPW